MNFDTKTKLRVQGNHTMKIFQLCWPIGEKMEKQKRAKLPRGLRGYLAHFQKLSSFQSPLFSYLYMLSQIWLFRSETHNLEKL